MSYVVVPKAAVDILPCSTFYSLLEEQFIERVHFDVLTFVCRKSPEPVVLIFPAVSPRLRFLIHQVVETNFSAKLKTFSIGNIVRRTVVCSKFIEMENYSSLDSPISKEMSTETKEQRRTKVVKERAIYRPPPARCILQETTTKPNVDSSVIDDASNANLKRPSLALYVPKGRKSSDSQEEKTARNVSNQPPSVIKNLPKKSVSQIRIPVEDESSQSPKWNSEPNCPTSQPIRKISRVCSNPISEPSVVDLAELMESSELAELSNQVHENSSYSTRKVSVASQVVKDTSYDEDSWDKLYNDTGDLLRPDALEELTLAVGKVQIIQPPPDAYNFIEPDSHDEDLTHVIEVYEFPSTLKTEDLFVALTRAGSPPDFSLKWVDDTHALAIYGSPIAAVDALSTPNGIVKLRPISQATKESRNCARRISSALQPFKPRPATSATLAKRLVSTALGIKNTVSPEQRKMERQMLADAKAKKRMVAQQKEAAWEGTLSTP